MLSSAFATKFLLDSWKNLLQEKRIQVSQAGLELAKKPRMTLNF